MSWILFGISVLILIFGLFLIRKWIKSKDQYESHYMECLVIGWGGFMFTFFGLIGTVSMLIVGILTIK